MTLPILQRGSHQEKWARFTLDHSVETGEPSNEVQTLTVDATGGTYTITCLGHTTAGIAPGATAVAVKAALVSAGVATGDVAVTGGVGAAGGGTPYTFTFGGAQAGVNVAQMTTNAGSLTGGASTATVATQTAGGTAGVLTLRDEQGQASKLPDNAIITRFFIEPEVDFATPGGTPTIKLGVDDAGLGDDLFIGATAYNNGAFLAATQDLTDGAPCKKVNKVDGCAVIATVAAADISAGKLHVHIGMRAGV